MDVKDMGMLETCPTEAMDALTKGLHGETPWLLLEADMDMSGRFGASWLAVSENRLAVWEPGEPSRGVREFARDGIESIEARHHYGNDELIAIIDGSGIRLVRFSKSHSDKFDVAAKALTAWAVGKDPGASAEGERKRKKENRCPKCGRFMAGWRMVCPACADRRQVFLRLLGHLVPHLPLAVSVFTLSLVGTAVGLIPPLLTRTMIDRVLPNQAYPNGDIDLLKWVVLGILGIHLTTSAINGTKGFLVSKLGQGVTLDMRNKLYSHLQTLSISYYDRRQTGWIMQRVTGDVSHLQGFMVNGVQDILVQVLTLVCIGAILFSLNWKLALLTLFPTPFVAFASSRFAKRIRVMWHRIWRRQSDLTATLADTLPGIRVVKAFGREADEVARFFTKQQALFRSHLAAARMSNVFYPTMGFVVALGGVIVWGFGGTQVINGVGGLTTGTLVAFISYMWQFYGPVQQLSRLSGTLQEAATAAERVFEVLDTQPQVFDTKESRDMGTLRGDITFENVGFAYEKGEPVIKGVSLEIKAGEMIGLVGASGAGKTTLINLLSRFYDPTEGNIHLDGVNILDIKVGCLRDQMAVVLQEPFLFHGSIAENIAYGRTDATWEEIVWAAKMANAHEFICGLPDGYESRLGERGIGLSGGQKQRISIARAILKDPRILILDEATSAVDTQTEHLIQEAISRLVKGRTTIAIAHRLSTLKNADRIAVLKDGELAEVGTHDELLGSGGVFSELVRMQSEIAKSVAV